MFEGKAFYSTSPEVQTDAKPRVVKNQRTPNKAGSRSLNMERAPERSPNHPSVASVAGRRRRSAQSARAAGPRRWVGPLFVADVAGTAQTPASLGRLGVEGTTEEMGAGACTQTPGAPAAGRSAAATRQRDKCALPHGDSAVPLMAPLTPALKSTINTSSSAEAALPNGESGAAVDGTAMPFSPVRPVVWLDVFRSPTPEDPATPRTPKAGDGFRQRVVRSGTADSIDGHTHRAQRERAESITRKLTASPRHWNVDDWRDRVRGTGIYALEPVRRQRCGGKQGQQWTSGTARKRHGTCGGARRLRLFT